MCGCTLRGTGSWSFSSLLPPTPRRAPPAAEGLLTAGAFWTFCVGPSKTTRIAGVVRRASWRGVCCRKNERRSRRWKSSGEWVAPAAVGNNSAFRVGDLLVACFLFDLQTQGLPALLQAAPEVAASPAASTAVARLARNASLRCKLSQQLEGMTEGGGDGGEASGESANSNSNSNSAAAHGLFALVARRLASFFAKPPFAARSGKLLALWPCLPHGRLVRTNKIDTGRKRVRERYLFWSFGRRGA